MQPLRLHDADCNEVLDMTQPSEPTDDDVVANLARLEQALERIAQGATPRVDSTTSGAMPSKSAMISDRLDALIAKLRAELGDPVAETE